MGADDGEFLLLKRINPAYMDMGVNSTGKAERGERDIGDPLVQVGFADASNLIRQLASDKRKDDGKIVRSEAPEGIFLAPDFAEIEPVGSDVLQLAEFAGCQKLLNFSHAGVILKKVPNHEDESL